MSVARFEIATGGDPLRAYLVALFPLLRPGLVATMNVFHDDGCPCTSAGLGMRHCTCELVVLEFEEYVP